MKIAKSFVELIGKTPMVEIERYNKNNALKSKIIVKVEEYNPTGSVKDRAALAMIEAAEREGKIKKGTVIIEPTSGNTGIGLAFIAAVKGYRMILTMPESMSVERRKLLKAYGADVVLTPNLEGMPGAIKKAEELAKEFDSAFIPQQFDNPNNPKYHKETTAVEIYEDTEGTVDIVVAGVGSGGTISGIGEYLKEKNPNIKIVAVEPLDSAVISGGRPGVHKLQGLGAGFIPKNYYPSVVDEVITVSSEDAFDKMKELTKTEGIFAGISSGAALHAATEIAKKEVGKNIVVILPDTGFRYLSEPIFEE
ncbi:cysteine synthase A [Clostridium cellulovorans]|uniref:Cysteine synthase n=1 Tax=Clostridium cellulovorans (strain ATCC 35296 / DSM 3052 / OCM 3 / 743B) TaxID=573061 RepID=D9SQ53_CLOC7|nr:cysteine synthase A [Clostridium cellulovorans]ADL52189.1 cysteine synthase [Clostridium cellulovorans 743B]